MKALLIRLDHVGDVFLCTPLLRALSQAGYRTELMVPEAAAQLFDGNPHVAAIHDLRQISPQFPYGWGTLSRWLRRGGFDVLILPYARQPALLWASFFSGIPTRMAMWSGIWGRLTLHHCLRSGLPGRLRPFADILLDCARRLGIPPGTTRPELYLPTAVCDAMARQVVARTGGRRLVGIHPGCGGSSCNLPPAEYGRLAALLLQHRDVTLAATGVAAERAMIATWPASVQASDRLWNTMGDLTLQQLAALIRQMAVYVVPSTGPLHLANWADVATVSPFCAAPTLSAAVWGNDNGKGVALAPPPDYCLQRRRVGNRHCDFSGHVNAETLYAEVIRLLWTNQEMK